MNYAYVRETFKVSRTFINFYYLGSKRHKIEK